MNTRATAMLLASMVALSPATSCATPRPLEVSLVSLDEATLPPSAGNSSSSGTVRALRVVLKNTGRDRLRLVWGDFFVRVNGGPWVGGWWEHEKSVREKLVHSFGSPGLFVELAPGASLEYTLVDPWVRPQDSVEYKFTCLASHRGWECSLAESPPASAAPVTLGRSGVELALSGVSSALDHLLSGASSPSPSPGDFSVLMSHVPAGSVEAAVSEPLREEVSRRMGVSGPVMVSAYRTEVANDTPSPLRLVMLEQSVEMDGKWISGFALPAIVDAEGIRETGFLGTVDKNGRPRMSGLEDLQLPPGTRAIFPYHWHAPSPEGKPTRSRWRAVLLDPSGAPFYAESVTPQDMPLVMVPPPRSSPLPSPVTGR